MRDNESDNGGGWHQPDSYIGPWATHDEGDPGHVPYQGWSVSAAPPTRRRRRRHLGVYLGVAVLAAGVGAGLTFAFDGQGPSPSAGISRDIRPPDGNGGAAGSPRLNATTVEQRVEPGLVDITSTLKYESETAEGTGMILSSSGLVLTNNHVIDGATIVHASLVEGRATYTARVVGYDAKDDVALLKLIGASRLATVSFGNSSRVQLGAAVLALGDAEGRGGVTPAPGVISALNRSIQASDEGSGTIEYLNHMLQTNAKIQQGDSGGALADSAGQVIGMITAANTSPGGTMGFAIPINDALTIAHKIADGLSSSTVYIGVPGFLGVVVSQGNSPNPRQQAADERRLGSPNGGGHGGAKRVAKGGQACVADGEEPGVPSGIAPAHAGALVLGVLCGTPAQARGLGPGDVITSVDGQAVTTPASLTAITAEFHAGAVVHVGWEGPGGARHTTAIRLGNGPAR